MKTCCMCKKELPLEFFRRNKGRLDGYQSQCVECHKEYRRQHYLKNKEKYVAKAAEWKSGLRNWWREYKATKSCVRCGENHPACIHFHHPDDNKEASVCQLVQSGSKARALREIAKCVPLCANCHAKEHWRAN